MVIRLSRWAAKLWALHGSREVEEGRRGTSRNEKKGPCARTPSRRGRLQTSTGTAVGIHPGTSSCTDAWNLFVNRSEVPLVPQWRVGEARPVPGPNVVTPGPEGICWQRDTGPGPWTAEIGWSRETVPCCSAATAAVRQSTARGFRDSNRRDVRRTRTRVRWNRGGFVTTAAPSPDPGSVLTSEAQFAHDARRESRLNALHIRVVRGKHPELLQKICPTIRIPLLSD